MNLGKIGANTSVKSYIDIVREERFYCAVLFHLLLNSPSEVVQTFLRECGVEKVSKVKGVFVEYAMVRDLWKNLGENCNEEKLDFIVENLSIELDSPLRCWKGLNKAFVSRKNPSTKKNVQVQSPSNWGLKKIWDSDAPNDVKIKATKLKWAFNIKPDIVIEFENDAVLCIEAKLESGVDKYIDAKQRSIIEQKLGKEEAGEFIMKYADQFKMQEFVMKKILGFDDVTMTLLRKSNLEKYKNEITWNEVFEIFKDEISNDKCKDKISNDFLKRLIATGRHIPRRNIK